MAIIDSQVHAYEANTPNRPWHSVPNWPDHVTGDEMVAAMDRVGVDGAILISAFSLYRYDASYALEVQRAHPGRFPLVKPVDPAAPALGAMRWSGEATAEHLRRLRRTLAALEVPLTLERAPWELRRSVGIFGAYREGVGQLVGALRETFDPAGVLLAPLGEPVHNFLRPHIWVLRGLMYLLGIWLIEFITGWLLRRLTGKCPWDYSHFRGNIKGIITPQYAPVWFLFCLGFERVHDALVKLTPALKSVLF